LFQFLEDGKIERLVKEFKNLGAKTKKQRKMVETETNYFIQNKHRMRYKKFKAMDLFVGSGVIEVACKNVVGIRLKRSGMKWCVKGANEIMALRCNILSQDFYSTLPTNSELPIAA
jgi:hypothetical protein